MCCENSGVLKILHPHRNEIALNAKIKMDPWPPWAQNRAGPWADGSLGPERPRFRMSLWEFWGSQSCNILGTPEFSQRKFGTSEDAIWFDMGGSLEFPNDTLESMSV